MKHEYSQNAEDSFRYSPSASWSQLNKSQLARSEPPAELIKSKITKLRKEALLNLLSIQETHRKSMSQIQNTPSKFTSISNFFPSPQTTTRTETRKQDLINYYNQITAFKVSDTESKLNKHCKVRINELLLIFREKQALVHSPERVAKEFEGKAQKALQEFNKILTSSLEDKYRGWLLKRLDEKQAENKEMLNELVARIEETQYARLKQKKTKFVQRAVEEKRNELTPQENEELAKVETMLKRQADEEVKETLEALEGELEKVLKLKYEDIDEQRVEGSLKKCEEEFKNWELEVKQEPNYLKNQERIAALESVLVEKIRQDVKERVKTNALINQSQAYEKVHSELSQEFEEFRKKIDLKTKTKIEVVEQEFQENFYKQLYLIAEKEVRPIEIKIKMNYHKKLDNLKESLRKEMGKQFLLQYKNFRRTVELEKISFCQYRANYNVYNKNLEKEVKTQHELKSKEKVLLSRKTSDRSFIKYQSVDGTENTKKTEDFATKTAMRSFDNRLDLIDSSKTSKPISNFNMQDEKILKMLTKPLPPPEFQKSLESQIASKPSYHKTRIISPSLTEEFFNSLLGNQSEAEKTLSRSASNPRSQSVRLDLTKKPEPEKQFKYIRPRK